jgi:hypothetical protein
MFVNIINEESQNNKLCSGSKSVNQYLSIIECPYLYVKYQLLERVTQNFPRNSCSNLRSLYLSTKCQIPQHVRDYFPHTKIRV